MRASLVLFFCVTCFHSDFPVSSHITLHRAQMSHVQHKKNKVKKLIDKFENHKHKESFLQDLSQTQKINKFSEESQDLFADLNNSNVLQCLLGIGIIYCSCGRILRSSRSPTEFDQNNRGVTSIPVYVIEKNSSRRAKHGPSERQRMYYQAKQMLKKARQKKHGRRWHASKIMLYDRIALEKHIYVATRAERIQNSKHWILTINAEGPQRPLDQRPDFAQAKRECNQLHDEHLGRTQEE